MDKTITIKLSDLKEAMRRKSEEVRKRKAARNWAERTYWEYVSKM